MNEKVVSFDSARRNRAAADEKRLGAQASDLRRALRQITGEHILASLTADAIELSDVAPEEVQHLQLTNALVWFEAEAERIRCERQELEASMREKGIVQKLGARLPA